MECVARGIDPLTAYLVVADSSRTEKTICLAVSPALKAIGVGGRPRLFEVNQQVNTYNKAHPENPIKFITAPPRMAHYIEVSTAVYEVYLKYVSEENIHVYSIDEVFIDVTPYLSSYKMTAHDLAIKMIRDVLSTTGITATAGIGTNLYLAKVAMDIVAKHMPADKDGVRIAELDEMTYRRQLWDYRPLSKFWQVGRGISERLAPYGIDTMGKIARLSLENEDLLYHLFGVHAELLIDHAWGWEPCTIELIKQYRPKTSSLSRGQVLSQAYDMKKARVVVREMADDMSLTLVEKRLLTDNLTLTVNYDVENLKNETIMENYRGEIVNDWYGRSAPKHAHGTGRLPNPTSSSRVITDAFCRLFDHIVNPALLIRRITLTVNHLIDETRGNFLASSIQLDLFDEKPKKLKEERAEREKERRLQEAQLAIKRRFGKNAILKGTAFEEGATSKQRNNQIGGHKS